MNLDGATSTVQRDFAYELLDSEGNVVENEDIRISDRRVQVTAPVYLTKELPLTVKYKESPGSTLETARCRLAHESITVAGIYTLSLHDALPISQYSPTTTSGLWRSSPPPGVSTSAASHPPASPSASTAWRRGTSP